MRLRWPRSGGDIPALAQAAVPAANRPCAAAPPTVAGVTLTVCKAGDAAGTACVLTCSAGSVATGTVVCEAGQWAVRSAGCSPDWRATCATPLPTNAFPLRRELRAGLAVLEAYVAGDCAVLRLTVNKTAWLAFGTGREMAAGVALLSLSAHFSPSARLPTLSRLLTSP